jgi:hypothetical protein
MAYLVARFDAICPRAVQPTDRASTRGVAYAMA